jgi:hypothetical protein
MGQNTKLYAEYLKLAILGHSLGSQKMFADSTRIWCPNCMGMVPK